MSLPVFVVPSLRSVQNRPGSDAEDTASSSEALIEYLGNVRMLEMSGKVDWQIRLINEALAANYIRDVLTPKWGR